MPAQPDQDLRTAAPRGTTTLRERVEGVVARTLFGLPRPLLTALFTKRRRVYRDVAMDPVVQLAMALHALVERPPLDALSWPQARAEFEKLVQLTDLPPRPLRSIQDRTIAGPGGDLALRIYRDHAGVLPALLYVHGGGYVVGGLDSHDAPLRQLAHESQCVVVAVDYRLAPEHPFPAAVDDAQAAFLWLHAHAAELDVDPARLAMGGDSAGGNLTAVVCQSLARQGLPLPQAQLLIYPATDMATPTRSRQELTQGVFLEPALLDWFTRHYLQDAVPRSDVRASPLLAPTLAGQPPALVLTCGFDPLLDEGTAYGQKLAADGVPVEFLHFAAQMHGLLGMAGVVPEGRAAISGLADYLRRRLSPQR